MKEDCCNDPDKRVSKPVFPDDKPSKYLSRRRQNSGLYLMLFSGKFIYYSTLISNKMVSGIREYICHLFSLLRFWSYSQAKVELMDSKAKQHSKVMLEDAFYYHGVCQSFRDDFSGEQIQHCKELHDFFYSFERSPPKESRHFRDFYFDRFVVLPQDANRIMSKVRKLKEKKLYAKD